MAGVLMKREYRWRGGLLPEQTTGEYSLDWGSVRMMGVVVVAGVEAGSLEGSLVSPAMANKIGRGDISHLGIVHCVAGYGSHTITTNNTSYQPTLKSSVKKWTRRNSV